MRAFQVWAIGTGLICLGWTGCREAPKKPAGPDPAVTALKKKLENAGEQIDDLERQLVRLEEQRRDVEQELKMNQQRPEVILQHRLDMAVAEGGAVLGWLRSAKKAAAGSTDLQVATELEVVRDRAEKWLAQFEDLDGLYGEYRAKHQQSPEAQKDLDVMATQWDWLQHCGQEMQDELKAKP